MWSAKAFEERLIRRCSPRHGRAFLASLKWSLSAGIMTFVLKKIQLSSWDIAVIPGYFDSSAAAYTGFSSLLGFLVVFRTSQSYNRHWEGCALTYGMMGDWLECASSVVAFSAGAASGTESADRFRHTVIRLFSLLFACALAELEDMDHEETDIEGNPYHRAFNLELLDVGAFDDHTLSYLKTIDWKVELVTHWILTAMTASRDFVVPPPIITRAYHELASGTSKFNDCLKIVNVPFPPPYDHTLTGLLVLHWIISPWVVCNWTQTSGHAGLLVFLQVFVLWSLTFIAKELEQPFGDDDDDLNVEEVQKNLNARLLLLLHPAAQHMPRIRETYATSHAALCRKLKARSGLEFSLNSALSGIEADESQSTVVCAKRSRSGLLGKVLQQTKQPRRKKFTSWHEWHKSSLTSDEDAAEMHLEEQPQRPDDEQGASAIDPQLDQDPLVTTSGQPRAEALVQIEIRDDTLHRPGATLSNEKLLPRFTGGSVRSNLETPQVGEKDAIAEPGVMPYRSSDVIGL
eukprot:gnl/TRDRNA2_/TRDRNA2_174750_c1_seq2.p1 gnl/TRDRNA2_/TRDRNA2_174750_c1~~gnl/TRDRNA2_/TRDRNA2_174750_c1_seq2.p1  ORF type:complete len:517 (+),score=63.43 gnl/TRDRNA2_/TRDRNA2_174750_c1_seq2:84-1634(+)